MTETEVEVVLEGHRKEIGSLKHRMDDVEKMVNVVHQLANEMVGLTKEIGHMNNNIYTLTRKVADMESRPGKRWESVVMAIIGAVIGAVTTRYL